jgi:capsule biosynthesis phosphatase
MNVLVLCAGRGQRFLDAGYLKPKPIIDVGGVPMIKRTTDSLPKTMAGLEDGELAFAILTDHATCWDIDRVISCLYPQKSWFVPFDKVTRGNLETAFKAVTELVNVREAWDRDEPLLILDCDNVYDGMNFEEFLDDFAPTDELSTSPQAAAICYFEPIDDKTHWCFAELQATNGYDKVWSLLEKNPRALEFGGKPMMGAFYFSSADLFIVAADHTMEEKIMTGGEFYMSQAVEWVISKGVDVYGIEVTDVRPLGTPEDLELQIKPIRICLDLDDTINYCKKPGEEYGAEKAQERAIEVLRKWKAQGHYIIIQTARHMHTCDGNVGKVIARQGMNTLKWLEENDVPFDEIYFGKPHADVFIDDKAIRHEIGNWEQTERLVENFLMERKSEASCCSSVGPSANIRKNI